MRSYELMYILDPGLDEDASGALLGRIGDLMSKEGVEVEKTEPWGKRRLAYAIKGNWEGNYVLSYLKAEPSAVSEIERRLRVTDGVLRFLTVRIDEQHEKLERQRARAEEKSVARKRRKGAKASAAAAAAAAAAPTPPTPSDTKSVGSAGALAEPPAAPPKVEAPPATETPAAESAPDASTSTSSADAEKES